MKMKNGGKQKLACFEQEPAGAGRSFSFPLPFCSLSLLFLVLPVSVFSRFVSHSSPLCFFLVFVRPLSVFVSFCFFVLSVLFWL
jgi:hypothetical protein